MALANNPVSRSLCQLVVFLVIICGILFGVAWALTGNGDGLLEDNYLRDTERANWCAHTTSLNALPALDAKRAGFTSSEWASLLPTKVTGTACANNLVSDDDQKKHMLTSTTPLPELCGDAARTKLCDDKGKWKSGAIWDYNKWKLDAPDWLDWLPGQPDLSATA